MAAQGNTSYVVDIPVIERAAEIPLGAGSLSYGIDQIAALIGLTTDAEGGTGTDIVFSDFLRDVCHDYSTVLYRFDYCCAIPEAGPSQGEVPTVQVPTLLDQLEPMLDTFQAVPVEEDDQIFIRDLRCYEPVADIPLEDLAAVSIGVDDDQADPGPPVNPVAHEGVPDPFEGYDRVDVQYPDIMTRDGLPSSQCSLDPDATPNDPESSQLMVGLPIQTSEENAARLADTLRLRSQVERPVKFWTAPKWLKLNVNDIVTINTYHGQLKVRIINITIGADWVLEFDSVTCNRLAHYAYEFFATGAHWPVPTGEQMEQGLDYGFDPGYSNGTGGVWDTVRFAPPGQLPPGVTPVSEGS